MTETVAKAADNGLSSLVCQFYPVLRAAMTVWLNGRNRSEITTGEGHCSSEAQRIYVLTSRTHKGKSSVIQANSVMTSSRTRPNA